jgi:hypothetical protein
MCMWGVQLRLGVTQSLRINPKAYRVMCHLMIGWRLKEYIINLCFTHLYYLIVPLSIFNKRALQGQNFLYKRLSLIPTYVSILYFKTSTVVDWLNKPSINHMHTFSHLNKNPFLLYPREGLLSYRTPCSPTPSR